MDIPSVERYRRLSGMAARRKGRTLSLNLILPALDNLAGFVFATGLALILVHNPKVSDWLIPNTGLYFILFTMPYLLLRLRGKAIKFEPFVHIPMLVIFLFTGLAMGLFQNFHFLNSTQLLSADKTFYSPIFLVFICVAVYLIVKANNKIIEIPFVLVTIAATIGIVWTAFSTGLKSGGWVTVENYDTIVPLLLIGCLVCPKSWRFWMSGVSVAGLFFAGAEIGLACVVLVGIVILVRRDFSRKLLIPIGALALCLIMATPFGITQKLWVHNGVQGTLGDRIQAATWVMNGEGNITNLDYLVTGNRINGNWHIRPITLTGHGLEINKLTESTPHNQFLIMTDQIGIIGALAWLVATFAWAWKTRNWYLFIILMGVGLLDHFFWTAGILWWWMIIGIGKDGDLIYASTSQKLARLTVPVA